MEVIREYIDQLGRRIEVQPKPIRIISLVPSQTELLFNLGLEKEVVGITKFCIHPKEWHKSKSRVGGTKTIDFEKIKALNPDLIIANKEENDQAQIEQLAMNYAVWISDINDLSSALSMIESVSKICNKIDEGRSILNQAESNFSGLDLNLGSAIYLIWNEPLMASGSDSFISEMMKHAGFENVIEKVRYPQLSKVEIEAFSPEFILLSSEPFPFNLKHQKHFQSQFPESKVILVDGEIFSWYGSRLMQAPGYFQNLADQLQDQY